MSKSFTVVRTYQNGNDSSTEKLREMLNEGWRIITSSAMPTAKIGGTMHDQYLYGYIEYVLVKE